MSRFKKWFFQNKKRHYKVVYTATGFMSNRYDVGTFEFSVSDREIKEAGFDTHGQYGFYKNYKILSRFFPVVNNIHTFLCSDIK